MRVTPSVHLGHAPDVIIKPVDNIPVVAFEADNAADERARPGDKLAGIIDVCNKPVGVLIDCLNAAVTLFALQPVNDVALFIPYTQGETWSTL